jgi:hypothetical protein
MLKDTPDNSKYAIIRLVVSSFTGLSEKSILSLLRHHRWTALCNGISGAINRFVHVCRKGTRHRDFDRLGCCNPCLHWNLARAMAPWRAVGIGQNDLLHGTASKLREKSSR